MKSDSVNERQAETLKEIVFQLEEDKKNAQKNLNRNLDRISEINISLKNLLDKENFDTDIFSPRNIEKLYGEQVAAYNEEKNALEEENRNYYITINKLSDILAKIRSFQSVDSVYRVVPRKNQDKHNAFVLLETDRQRIAKDLHDTSLQNLTAIVHKVELASMYINQDPIRAKMELSLISDSIKETINEIRDTIFELRPMSFDDLGFRDLLASYIEKEKENKNIKVIFNKYNLSITDQSYLIFIFRVIKECLGNSVKHSKCKEIQLVIDDSDGKNLIIEIIDDGTGFDVEDKNFVKNKHFGLTIIRERVNLMQGNIEMISNENGTKVHISVPLNIV